MHLDRNTNENQKAAFAISEETIASSPELCGTTSPNALGLIRADFTTCSLPSGALGPNCIQAASNEPDNCGFSNNLPSLCSYCAASSPNATDSCCLYSGTETRCQGVHLPFTTSMGTLFPSATSQANSTAPVHTKGLSGGQVAGIVVGSILGAILLLALIIGACLCLRRRENRPNEKLNTPSPTRARGGLSYSSPVRPGEPDLPHGARVHQMVALEGSGAGGSDTHGSPGAPYLGSSSGYDDTPESQRSGLGVGGAPKRGGSLSRHSDNGGLNNSSSPNYGSSPEGMASGQSEQMSHFKDYYSTDDIHPGNLVATLWAYQPRANDEWDLERGDMLKIVGIWDDGWATGYKLRDRAEDWETRRNPNRDSGVSNGSTSQQVAPGSAPSVPDGEIKAFPVCPILFCSFDEIANFWKACMCLSAPALAKDNRERNWCC